MKLDKFLEDESVHYDGELVPDFKKLHVIGTSREEAEKFIKEQMDGSGGAKKKYKKTSDKWHSSPQAHHYGKCELIDLLDLLYGEKVTKWT